MTEDNRKFDLNIEHVLEHWTIAHALREVIANALDEAALTGTDEPLIFKDDNGSWHIKDAGRGLCYEHLTQNENMEKLKHSDLVIGKFGVGLKDALATFDRHNIQVFVFSPHGDITIDTSPKHGFANIKTLHAIIHSPSRPHQVGTEFILTGLKDEDITKAKDFFLLYSGDEVISKTPYGTILRHSRKKARIYVNGLFVAEEENFLFSYNITSLTTALKKALNRERTNVGRTAYTERVKSTLLACQDPVVADVLARDLQKLDRGTAHDELQWTDVQRHACRILNANEKVVFVTSEQLLKGGSLITYAQQDGYRIVVIPNTIAIGLNNLKDIYGNVINTLDEYLQEWNDSFHFTFIDPDQLNPNEQAIYMLTESIMRLLLKRPKIVKQVLISETMRLNSLSNHEALGVWEEKEQRIVIKRSQLQDPASYAGTLLHECIHALSGTEDETLEFENELTQCLGILAEQLLKIKSSRKTM